MYSLPFSLIYLIKNSTFYIFLVVCLGFRVLNNLTTVLILKALKLLYQPNLRCTLYSLVFSFFLINVLAEYFLLFPQRKLTYISEFLLVTKILRFFGYFASKSYRIPKISC